MDLELVDDLDLICKVCNQLLWLFWHVQSALTYHCKSFLVFEYQSYLQATTYLHLKLKSKKQSSEVKFSLWRNFCERGRLLSPWWTHGYMELHKNWLIVLNLLATLWPGPIWMKNTTAASKYITKRSRICINWKGYLPNLLENIYRTRAIISRSWLQAALEYKPYIRTEFS